MYAESIENSGKHTCMSSIVRHVTKALPPQCQSAMIIKDRFKVKMLSRVKCNVGIMSRVNFTA